MHWICPVCGGDAVQKQPRDLTPMQRRSPNRPRFSHRNGTQLCLVKGRRYYYPADAKPAR